MNDWNTKLDRLADGELSRDEYAALLNSLDQVEDGWKSCALALLESQALKMELRKVVDEPPPAQQPLLAHKAGAARPFMSCGAQALAVAACLGLAFWLGRGSLPKDDIANVAPGIGSPEQPEPSQSHQGRMTLVMAGPDGQPREMELPVVDGEFVDPKQFLARSTEIPAEVLEAIERSGHKIERHREFLRQPVDAEHEVVVPVDRVRVVPVSMPRY